MSKRYEHEDSVNKKRFLDRLENGHKLPPCPHQTLRQNIKKRKEQSDERKNEVPRSA